MGNRTENKALGAAKFEDQEWGKSSINTNFSSPNAGLKAVYIV